MERSLIWRSLNVIMVLLVIGVNALANALPLNGQRTGEISDRFQVYFVPAGYVFSIWSLIYLGLLAFAVYQALPSQRHNQRLARLDGPVALSCAANIAWLFLWHYEQFPATLLAMFALLGLLIAIHRGLRAEPGVPTTWERWAVWLPFSIYLGWISVATIANVSVVLDYLRWDGWGVSDAWWAVIMLAVATLLATLMGVRRRDIPYMVVIIWAFVGIAIKQSATPLVAWSAWTTSGALGVLLLLVLWRPQLGVRCEV